jgi:hypothetical protein
MQIKIIQNHFTVRFQMKSAADLRVCSRVLSYRMPTLMKAATAIGYKYDIGFSILNENTLLLSGYFECDFDVCMDKLAKSAGTVFDSLFRHVQNPPSTPVSGNAAVFVSWVSRHRITLPDPLERNLN